MGRKKTEIDLDVEHLQDYDIESKAGEGMLGSVYKARDTRSDSTVALKVLKTSASHLASQIQTEFRLLSTFHHPHLVDVYDYGITAGARPYYAMQWVSGKPASIDHFTDDSGAFNEQLFAEFVHQVSSALIYLKARGIAHGDIKPENILVGKGKDGKIHAYLMDFGISRSFTDSNKGLSGTFEYMAPEIIRGEAPSPASDLYSLGCVLYELLHEKAAFGADTPLEVLKAHLADKAPEFTADIVTDEIVDWISTCLSKDIRLRYRTPEQLYSRTCAFLNKESDVKFREEEAISLDLIAVPREKEVAKLNEISDSSIHKFNFFVITGEEGVGKSHLLSDFRVQLQLQDRHVELLRSMDASTPLSGVLGIISRLPKQSMDSESLRILASFNHDLFPEIQPASKSHLMPDAEITRLFHAIVNCFSSSTCDVLLIDDLHAQDPLTIEFVDFFASFGYAQHEFPFLLGATFDNDLIDRNLLPQDVQEKGTTIALQPLTKDIVQKNIEAIFSGQLSHSFNDFVWNHSRGNPETLKDLLRYCLEEGVLEKSTHGWIVNERDDLAKAAPDTILEKLQHRLTKVSGNALNLLKIVALSEVPIELEVLEFVTKKSIDRIHELCLELINRDLVDVVEGRYILTTKTLATFLELDVDEKASLHGRYIDFYNENQDYTPPVGKLAAHYLGANRFSEAAIKYIEAGEQAERAFDFVKTKEYLSKALSISGAITDDEQQFSTYRTLVRTCNILGDRDQEAEYIEELLILAGRWKGKKGALHLADAYEQQAEYHLALGDLEKARRSSERALKYNVDAGNALGVARCQQKIGFILHRTNPNEDVLEYYNKALAIYAEREQKIDEADILVNIGLVYYTILDNPDEALRCFNEAIIIFESVGYDRGIARAYGNSGILHQAQSDYNRAFESHSRAQEIFARLGDYRATAISHLHVGHAQFAMGNYILAIENLETSLRMARGLNDTIVSGGSLEVLGEVYFHLGSYDHAQSAFEEAKTIASSNGHKIGEISNVLDIAEIDIELGNIAEALTKIQTCEKQLGEYKDAKVNSGCLFRYVQAYIAKGEQQDFPKALEYCIKLNEVASSQGYDDYVALANSYGGLCYAHMGRPSEALNLSNVAMNITGDRTYFMGGKQDILLNHARILRTNKGQSDAEDFVQKAYDEVMRIAGQIEDPKLYRSFTETVTVNAEIIREYSLLHRTDSTESLSIARDQNLRTLYDVSRKINSVLDLPKLLENIMDSALEAMNGERGLIFLLENEELVLKASRNVEKETIRDATEISLSILKDVVSGGQPIIISDTSKDDRSVKRESVVNYNIQSIICVPMKSKDNIIGTVYVDSRADALSAMSFSEIDIDFLTAFANLATMAIENARLHTRLQQENLYLKKEVTRQFGFENIIGASKAMEHLFREMQGAVDSDNTVLIYGESGTGKELIARAIHYNGKRKDRHFVAIDCGAFQDTLLESELFGYKRGAFTGAVSDKRGLFEEAHQGTLFLDEIGNTSLAFQAKLLRVLQSGEFRRVGDTDSKHVDVRIIAATNTSLSKQIEEGVFRQDLYYRLNVIPLQVPQLRDRLDDIPLLMQHFISEYNKKHGTSFEGASKELIDVLQQHSWPGNVRELENLVSRVLIQTQESVVSTTHLPADFNPSDTTATSSGELKMKVPLHLKTLKEIEQEHIRKVLAHTGNNKTEAAKILGLKRTTLVERMKKWGLM